MKNITTRAIVCILLALMLAAGTVLFVFRYFTNAGSWVSYPSNRHLYTGGVLNSGTVFDRNGNILTEYDNGWQYNKNGGIRVSTLHAVGDPGGLIGIGALTAFASSLTGYNPITGTNSIFSTGQQLYLTIDSDLCSTAYNALDGRSGTVGVYNYRTGEILCMVSSPSFDINGSLPDSDSTDGEYINRLLSSTFIPGSTFKLVTAAAALEKIPDIEKRTFDCTGSMDVGGYKVTCQSAHGSGLTLEDALNVSCNCAFGQLSLELGPDVMQHYAECTGLTSGYSVNGINTAKSTFDFYADGRAGLAWSGIGQGRDMVNPCAMMVLAGAIAGGSTAAEPQIIHHTAFSNGITNSIYIFRRTDKFMKPSTAYTLKKMMRSDVIKNYGQDNFPGLEICAKSGTAQVNSEVSDGWFVGFLDDNDHPYAFVCLVEGGGNGAKSAGSIINRVLQKAVL